MLMIYMSIGYVLVVNNGLTCIYHTNTAKNLKEVTFPISFTSKNSYALLCNLISTNNQQAWEGQVNIYIKETTGVQWIAISSATRQYIAIGF